MIVSKEEMLTHFDEIFNTKTLEYVDLNMGLISAIVENLYELPTLPSPSYKKSLHKQNQLADKLMSTMTPEQIEIFKEYQTIKNETNLMTDVQLFSFGFLFKTELDRLDSEEKK